MEMQAGCPFPNSPLDFDSGFGCARVRVFIGRERFARPFCCFRGAP